MLEELYQYNIKLSCTNRFTEARCTFFDGQQGFRLRLYQLLKKDDISSAEDTYTHNDIEHELESAEWNGDYLDWVVNYIDSQKSYHCDLHKHLGYPWKGDRTLQILFVTVGHFIEAIEKQYPHVLSLNKRKND